MKLKLVDDDKVISDEHIAPGELSLLYSLEVAGGYDGVLRIYRAI